MKLSYQIALKPSVNCLAPSLLTDILEDKAETIKFAVMTGKANILKLINKNFGKTETYKDLVIPTAR